MSLSSSDAKAAIPTLEGWQGLLSSSELLVLAVSREGHVLRASPAWDSVVGHHATLEQRPIESLVVAEDRVALAKALAPSQTAADPVHIRLASTSKDPVPVTLKPLPVSAAGDQILIFNDDARHAALTAELAESQHTAKQAELAKARFLAALSHDIRTPLNAIMGFSQLLGGSRELPEKVVTRVKSIYAAGQQLSDMIDDLLDIAQTDAVEQLSVCQPFDPSAVFAQIATTWTALARASNVTFESTQPDLDAAPEDLFLDVTRFQRCLNGFLRHAVSACVGGTVRLTASIKPRDTGHTLCFEIQDTRRDAVLSALRDSVNGFRTPGVGTTTGAGPAPERWHLGLAVHSQLLRSIGGDCSIDLWSDDQTRGAILRGEVPLSRAIHHEYSVFASDLDANDTGLAQVSDASLRILLAEDHSLSQDALRDMLQELGHTVVTVSNGYEALEAVQGETIDLVMMDIAMPGLSGLETSARIRALPEPACDVPIVGCTAFATAHSKAEYLEHGINSLLKKPVERASLELALAEAGPR